MSLTRTTARAVTAMLLALTLGACGEEDPSPGDLGQGSPPVPGDSAVLSVAEPEQLSDGGIAAVLAAIDSAEIAPSRLAVERAGDPQVVEFAEMMIHDHGALADSLRALVQTTGVTPSSNTISEQLETLTRATMESLEAQQGTAFDSAYAAVMVQSHEAALNSVETLLVPAAQNPELRSMLVQTVGPTVAAHLEQARQLQSTPSSR